LEETIETYQIDPQLIYDNTKKYQFGVFPAKKKIITQEKWLKSLIRLHKSEAMKN